MTIQEIAKRANISVSTVSKVLNGRLDVSDRTREKVLNIVNETGYRASMTVMDTDFIAVFVPIDKETLVSNPYFSQILFGICDVALKNNHAVSIISTYTIPKARQEFLTFCRQRKIRGGIFALLTLQDSYISDYQDQFPRVALTGSLNDPNIGSVEADNYSGGRQAAEHLVELGHKRIMLVNPSDRYSDHIERIRGASDVLAEAGIERMKACDIEDSISIGNMDLGYRLKHIFSSPEPPTAIFVASDQQALRFMLQLQTNSIRIPEDVSIVGFDNLQFARYLNPPLTTVVQPIYEIGREAARMLAGIIERTEQPSSAVLKTELIIRNSTAPPNGAK